MRRILRAVARRRHGSNAVDAIVQLSVPRDELHVLATDLGLPPFKSGTLLKYTNVVKRWKPRHFTLENGVLNYFAPSSDEEDDENNENENNINRSRNNHETPAAAAPQVTTTTSPERRSRKKSRRRRLLRRSSKEESEREIKGSINIQHAAISADDTDTCRFAIDVGNDVYHCKADTQALRDEWVAELTRSIEYFRGLIQRAVARAKQEGNNANANTNGSGGNNKPVKSLSSKKSSVNGGRLSVPSQQLQPQQSGMRSRVSISTQPAISPASTTNNNNTQSPADHHMNGPNVSEDSEESVLEDDGLREAEQGHRALVVELHRIVTLWRHRWLETASQYDDNENLLKTLCETFVDMSSMAAAASSSGTPVRSNTNVSPKNNNRNLKSLEVAAPEVAKGLIDLVSWCLHVLQTNDDVYDRRLKADLTRRMAGGLPVFPSNSQPQRTGSHHGQSLMNTDDFPTMDDDESDSEFVDALSRVVSNRSSFAHVRGGAGLHAKENEVPSPVLTNTSTAQDDIGILDEIQPDNNINDDDDKELNGHGNQITRIDTAALVKTSRPPRTQLPQLPNSRDRLNVFGLLKDAVGKDLSKITLPVGLNEPLSFVQRLAEDIEYCELLDRAAAEPDPNRRMMYVATMVISHYSSTQGRVGKPFNPLLGETACLIRPDKGNGVRFISEQVSHHPPISACYAEGSGGAWKYYNAIEVKNKFWGKSLEVFPTGLNHIEIPAYGDHYVLEQVTACVHNIVVGRLWLDNYGDMEIVNRTNGGRCHIEFVKTGWMSDARSFGAIKGQVYDADGNSTIKMGGNWTKSVYQDLGRGRKNTLWTVEDRPSDGESQSYNMTKWAISLNAEVDDDERASIPPTDSRLRPDQRALENGHQDLGSRLKQSLEEGQRKRRREVQEQGKTWQPLWFHKVTDEVTGQDDYRFTGHFFKNQAAGDWSDCPDIFSCAYDDPSASVDNNSLPSPTS